MDALTLACGNTPWATDVFAPVGEVAQLPLVPGREELDPLLARAAGGRLVVGGTDASLAAVVLRLLRRELLESVVVAYVPADPDSEAAAVWRLPTEIDAALRIARSGEAEPVPLIRDDNGGVLVGRGVLGPVRGVVYCDDDVVLRGQASTLEVFPDAEASADTSRNGLTVRVTRRGLLGKRVSNADGRAVQIGCLPATVERDGVPYERPVDKWTWYRHTTDWRLVRGLV